LRWTIILAAGELTPAGFKKMVSKVDVLIKLETVYPVVGAIKPVISDEHTQQRGQAGSYG
jgi:hypothetical protein